MDLVVDCTLTILLVPIRLSRAQCIHVTEYYSKFFASHCGGDNQNLRLFAEGGLKHCRTLLEPALNLPIGSFRRVLYLAEAIGFSAISFFGLM
jgi:hypothetical protein